MAALPVVAWANSRGWVISAQGKKDMSAAVQAEYDAQSAYGIALVRGGDAGARVALLDSLLHQACTQMQPRVPGQPPPSRGTVARLTAAILAALGPGPQGVG